MKRKKIEEEAIENKKNKEVTDKYKNLGEILYKKATEVDEEKIKDIQNFVKTLLSDLEDELVSKAKNDLATWYTIESGHKYYRSIFDIWKDKKNRKYIASAFKNYGLDFGDERDGDCFVYFGISWNKKN